MRSYILALVLLLAAGPAQATVIISQYIEGSGKNQAIEIWNTGSTDVDLTGWTLDLYFDGSSTPTKSIDLVGTVLAQRFGLLQCLADEGRDPRGESVWEIRVG